MTGTSSRLRQPPRKRWSSSHGEFFFEIFNAHIFAVNVTEDTSPRMVETNGTVGDLSGTPSASSSGKKAWLLRRAATDRESAGLFFT